MLLLLKAWRSGNKDSVTALAELSAWHADKLIPGGWLQLAASQNEGGGKEANDTGLPVGKHLQGSALPADP